MKSIGSLQRSGSSINKIRFEGRTKYDPDLRPPTKTPSFCMHLLFLQTISKSSKALRMNNIRCSAVVEKILDFYREIRVFLRFQTFHDSDDAEQKLNKAAVHKIC